MRGSGGLTRSSDGHRTLGHRAHVRHTSSSARVVHIFRRRSVHNPVLDDNAATHARHLKHRAAAHDLHHWGSHAVPWSPVACRAAAAPGSKIRRYERPRAERRSRSGTHPSTWGIHSPRTGSPLVRARTPPVSPRIGTPPVSPRTGSPCSLPLPDPWIPAARSIAPQRFIVAPARRPASCVGGARQQESARSPGTSRVWGWHPWRPRWS